MKFTLEIEMGNADMSTRDDVADALRRVSKTLSVSPLPADTQHILDGWGHCCGRWEFVPDAEPPTAMLVNGVLTCADCRSTEFKYKESHPSEREQISNCHNTLTFRGDFEWFDGDDDPGVVCARCDAEIGQPTGVEIEYAF